MGRAAWSRRPPLTRERKNQHLPPSRAGRVTFSWTLTRWSTAGRAGRQGFGGLAFPADGGTDGLGRSPVSKVRISQLLSWVALLP